MIVLQFIKKFRGVFRMEPELDVNQKINIMKEFRTKWSLENIQKMKLSDYSARKETRQKNSPDMTFIYDIENGDFKNVASIGSGYSPTFIIYEHDKPSKTTGMMHDDSYSWRARYGDTRKESFNAVKNEIVYLINSCKNNQNEQNFNWVYDTSMQLGMNAQEPTNFKKALLFLYQKENIENTTLISIFNKEILEYYIQEKELSLNGLSKKYYDLQKLLISNYHIKGLSDAIKKSEEILELWAERPIRFSSQGRNEVKQTTHKEIEGQVKEILVNAYTRNSTIVENVKNRDDHTCKSCNFSYKQKIVEAHHLIPLSSTGKTITNPDDLITLCPTCHRIAHHLLNNEKKNDALKMETSLIPRIQKVWSKAYKQ